MKVAYAYLSEIAEFAEKNGCKHEVEDALGLYPHGVLTKIQNGGKPNIEGTKLWNVLSIHYDVCRSLGLEELDLYVQGKLDQANEVRHRLTKLKNMLNLVMKG